MCLDSCLGMPPKLLLAKSEITLTENRLLIMHKYLHKINQIIYSIISVHHLHFASLIEHYTHLAICAQIISSSI